MSFLKEIYQMNFKNFTDNEREILKYIINNPQQVTNLSITELAEKTLTSKSSIFRVAQKLGFSGYSAFKYYLAEEIDKNNNRKFTDSLDNDLKQTRKLFKQADIHAIVKMLMESDQILGYATGVGQQNALDDFGRSLLVLDKLVMNIPASKELSLISSHLNETDTLIIVSLSGDIRNIAQTIQKIKLNGVKIIGVTRADHSLLSDLADKVIFFQTEPHYVFEKEIVSFHPLSYAFELLFQQIIEYYIEQRQERED
ncbi:MurR/RpiR family transcriptional regulator [Aerococcaceae bacterium DSM 111020]|nr:MurR/RpiR family transcriptional regulator [Aerococcaceae bacterium DSM 111020]